MESGVTATDSTAQKAPDLAALRAMYQEWSTLTLTARQASRQDDDYFHGYQWTPEEKAALKARKQPDSYFNRIRPAVLGTLGVLKKGETDPRAYPRTPQDEDAADVASKVLRFIADKNHFDDMKLRGAQQYLVQGTCAAIVEVDEDRQITVEPIRFEEFFYDPRSRREDFKDARYMGCAKWMYADDVAAMYPKAKKDLDDALDGATGTTDDLTDDRPSDGSFTVAWVDTRKRRVMVVEMYHREGAEWRRCVYHAGGLLDYGASPFLDEKGRPTNPIVAQSCFVDRENNRYGIVRDMRPVQDEINKRRSKLLHLLNSSQVEGSDAQGIGEDADLVRREAARPDGVIPFGYKKVSTSDMAAGQAQLLAEAKSEIERMGPNPEILGKQAADASGRAQLVRQQAGLTELAMVYGGIEDWELRLYVSMWCRARQFWTAPMYVRVTDDEGSPEFIGINQPPEMPGPPTMGPDGQPVEGQPIKGQFVGMQSNPQDPQAQPQPAFQMPDGSMVLGYKNGVAEMDVDIMLDSVPDTANVQQEQFQILAELAKFYPQDVTFDDLLETSTMPNKRTILEKRKARAEEAGQAQDPARELQQRGAMAEVSKLESEVELNRAKTQTELVKPELEAAKLQQTAESEALRLMHDGAHKAADREHNAGLQMEGMAQKDRQFEAGLGSKERLAAMKPPPGE